ncbi:MAG TPA: hypothetical protein VK445_01310 [Dissulfurispiraceae bacterium]|nr:hypothetical protein [Dissulfurispiraceae bacterium]
MIPMKRIAAVVLFLITLFFVQAAYAEEPKIALNESTSTQDVLQQFIGKRVAVRTDANETIDGIVAKVAGQFVYLEKLGGREFFDSVVKIDRISSITFRTKFQ